MYHLELTPESYNLICILFIFRLPNVRNEGRLHSENHKLLHNNLNGKIIINSITKDFQNNSIFTKLTLLYNKEYFLLTYQNFPVFKEPPTFLFQYYGI